MCIRDRICASVCAYTVICKLLVTNWTLEKSTWPIRIIPNYIIVLVMWLMLVSDWSDWVSKDSTCDTWLCKLQYVCLFECTCLILLTLSVSSVSVHSPSHWPGGLLSSMSGHHLGSYHSMGHQCSWNWSPGCHMTAISVCVFGNSEMGLVHWPSDPTD